jgi:hypothetical protein
MKTEIIRTSSNKMTVDSLPKSIVAGYILVVSADGQVVRNHEDLRYYQRFWVWIDRRMRKLLRI